MPPPPVVTPPPPDAAPAQVTAAPVPPDALPVPPPPRSPPPRRREAHDHPREKPSLVRTVDKPDLAAPESPAAVAATLSPQPAAAPAALSGAARATLEGEVRAAVQAALRYPMAARTMHLTGRARVLLDYHGGTVSHPSLLLSSGVPMLDEAALAAARVASYPKPPPDIGNRLLPMMIWIDFSSG
jgi:protein TonB